MHTKPTAPADRGRTDTEQAQVFQDILAHMRARRAETIADRPASEYATTTPRQKNSPQTSNASASTRRPDEMPAGLARLLRETGNGCPTCDGMGYITPNVPSDHRLFGQALPCPTCGGPVDVVAREQRLLEKYFGTLWMMQSPKLTEFSLDDFGRLVPGLQQGKTKAFTALYAWAKGELLSYEMIHRTAPTAVPFVPTHALVLSGSSGLGKTCGAGAAFLERTGGQGGLAIEYNALMSCIQARYADEYGDSQQAISAASKVPVLFLDDLGNMSRHVAESDDKQRIVFEILNHRYNYKLPTIITTNLGYHDLCDQFDRKLGQRLAEWALWVEVGGLSLRVKGE